jgi:hypothetical protein
MIRTKVPEEGWYRVTVRDIEALNPGSDEVVWGTLQSGLGFYIALGESPASKGSSRRVLTISKRSDLVVTMDSGGTWIDFRIVAVLPDGQKNRSYGCMGGLTIAGKDILLFSNIETPNADLSNLTKLGTKRYFVNSNSSMKIEVVYSLEKRLPPFRSGPKAASKPSR